MAIDAGEVRLSLLVEVGIGPMRRQWSDAMDASRYSQEEAEDKADRQGFFHRVPMRWNADKPFSSLNLPRALAFNNSKEFKSIFLSCLNTACLVFFLSIALSPLMGCAEQAVRSFPQKNGELSVDIEGFRSDEGKAIISLYAAGGGFPDGIEKAWQTQSVIIESGHVHVLFTGVPYGEYALSALHDEDGDGQMKKSWLGQPLEGFGFSGQPEYNFGPPAFTDTAFVIASATRELVVRMRYTTVRKTRQAERQRARDHKP